MPQKTIVITSGTTWVVPWDWNSANNRIEAIGGGAGGNANGGGGGAAYSRINNFAANVGQTIAISIGAGGAINANGGSTTFGNSSQLIAVGGGRASSSTVRAPGGTAAASNGTIKFNGGNGGVIRAGGGGAGGPAGIGANGFNGTMTVQSHANGGRAANNVGGGGGVAISYQSALISQPGGDGLDLSSNVVGFSISSQTFRYVRWSVTALRSAGSDMQVSEFILINSNNVLNMAGSTITPSRAASITEQGANNLIDGNLNSKYYTGVTTSPWNFTIDLGSAKTFDGYAWATGDDSTQRDPISWTLDVSSDNVNWTTVSTISNYSTTTTRKAYVPSTITIVGSGGGGAGSYYSDV